MANSSAKKLLKANQARLRMLLIAMLLSNAFFGGVRMLLFRSSVTTFTKIVWPVQLLLMLLPYLLIWSSARPTYSPNGTVVDPGIDVSQPGVLEYAHDLFFLSILSQLLYAFSKWALLLYLAVPAFAIYLAVSSGAFSSSSQEANEDEGGDAYAAMSRKERRKAERTARKQR